MKPFSTRTLCVVGVLLAFLLPLTVLAQPANDQCANAITLNSDIACNVTSGTLEDPILGASTRTTGISSFCGDNDSPDVWYIFTAQSTNPTITLSNMGFNMNSRRRIMVFNTTSCVVATLNANALACGTGASITPTVVIGQQYLIRVYTNNNNTTGSASNWEFDICITDPPPPPPPPPNDDCTGAYPLQVVASCGQFNLNGTVVGATITGGVTSACTGPVSYDVWYQFTAVHANETITLGGAANNFTSRRMELFRGTCGGLISVAPCGTTSIAATGLTPGNTYFIRVYSNSGSTAPTTSGDFTICVTTPAASIPPRFGNSYVNITKKTTGGVVQTGDTLEIRMTINYTGSDRLYKARYVDNIPTNTAMLSTTADSIRVITNEGKTFRRYTPLATDDPATYLPGPLGAGLYNIKMNIGFGIPSSPAQTPTAPAINNEGDITGAVDILAADRPRGGSGVLFATSFRVVVTGTPGQIITLGTGKFIYRTSPTGGDISLTTTPFQILISDPLTLCQSSIGLNNALESGGTFGHGTTLNRPTNLVTPIAGYTFVQQSTAQGIGDGMYGIVKNLSPRNGVNRNANRKNDCGTTTAPFDCNNRMHGGFWDVDGDHSGTSNSIGNVPPSAAADAGYMLVVNADYIASEVYTQNLTGLCPGTYYEFSAWMRNICAVCGIDSTPTSKYNPGVYPNLTFAMDGLDRYNTGEIDTLGWIKKGFVFLTGPTQTTASFSIRNNSQGGGGNDWAMDDIAVATCLPSMVYSPSANPTVCVLNASNISDTVRSFFNNYVYFKWQRSTDGGANYVDVSPTQGPATPTFNASLGLWEYVTNQLILPAWATLANNGDIYRVIAATTPGNITSTNCVVTNGVNFVTMNVLNCGTPLKTDLFSFNGKLNGDKAALAWVTSKEDDPLMYFIQRSTDGVNFKTVGSLNSHNISANLTNQYSFTDPNAVSGKVYYRLEMAALTNNKKYSRVIELSLSDNNRFAINNVINPFNQVLDFSINSPEDAKIEADLLDIFGKVVKRKTFVIHNGVSLLSFTGVEALPSGTYVLRIVNNDQIITKKVLKRNF